MTMGRVTWTIVLVLVIVACGVAWPEPVARYVPQWNERAKAIRAALPESVAARLPATPEAEAPASATAAARPVAGPGGRPANGGGAGGGGAGGPPGRPPVPVVVDTVQRGPMPVRIDAVGTAQPIASVALKTRIDATVDKILVADGAAVKQGDVLVKLDSRQIEAQIAQTEATQAKDQTAADQATRDVARYTDLFSKGSGTQTNLDTAKTSLAAARAVLLGDQAQLDNLRIQLSWYTMTAPISGHVSTFSAKAGNIIRSGDNTATGTLATIVQTMPIYVAFSIPQVLLPDLRDSMQTGGATVDATPQGGRQVSKGRITVLDNTIDPATGTVTARGTFENADEMLWPGQLCNVRVTLRVDPQTVSIARSATQYGQNGNFVYVIENNVARVRPVRVGRTQDDRDVIVDGLKGGETVVTEGALLLVDGARVNIRNTDAKKGAS